ncbi:hypothetical protein [Streptomyces sp. NBC_00448]|uniref:hypothetical protein n=1 Tax=Streptomyces sp. NBC_00448 TaxID=2903652 RepID=UPI002E1CB405
MTAPTRDPYPTYAAMRSAYPVQAVPAGSDGEAGSDREAGSDGKRSTGWSGAAPA